MRKAGQMKIAVCVKAAASIDDELPLDATGRHLEEDAIDRALNEWDAYAAEMALAVRESAGGEVIVLTVGGETAEPAVRRCLAMGADRAVRIETDVPLDDPLAVASLLAAAARTEEPDLILCGFQSSDTSNAAVPAALAAHLDIECETCVIDVQYEVAADRFTVRRELEGGVVEVRAARRPLVVSVQTGRLQPRYVTFRAIKQADQKPLTTISASPLEESSVVLRLFVPQRVSTAEFIDGTPVEIAHRIATIIKERTA